MKTNHTHKKTTMLIRNSCFLASLLATIAVSPVIASDPVPAPKQKNPIALIGGTVYTVSDEVIQNGIVLFDKGKITAVGTSVTIPQHAERVDARGKRIYPGIIDASSSLGLTEIGSVRGTLDMNETGRINPNVRAEVALHPESELIPVARSGGITIAVVSPSGGLISGTAAAIMMDGWTYEDMTVKAPLGLVVNWPSMVYSPGRFIRLSREDWLKQRDEQLVQLRGAFAEARAYVRAKDSESQKGVRYHDIDMRWEAMRPVLSGKIPAIVNANEVGQIQAAVSWAEAENVKLVIAGGRDAWRVADLLKAKDIPVIINPIHTAPMRRWEGFDEAYTTPAKLKEAGVRFCISGDYSASNSRNTPHHAATAAAYGLGAEEALKAITLYPAQILGLGDILGSIEAGKDATLMLTDGDPLELSTTVEQIFIQGKKIDMRDKHKQLYEKYKEKYKQLEEEKKQR